MYNNNPVEITTSGEKHTKEYAIFFRKEGKLISPWHDIPLINNKNFNFICEIPKWTRDKMEIITDKAYNPIKQDTVDGKLRRYVWGDMMFNYGALPQTWENPDIIDTHTGYGGDNDPLDAIDIGRTQIKCGQVIEVKVLGILGLIDQGKTDWKIIVINVRDLLANKLHDINDVEKYVPGLLDSLRDWLKNYKTAVGKEQNKFAFDGRYMNRSFAMKIIKETYNEWKKTFTV
jgi:inorganic pyrophosphatase